MRTPITYYGGKQNMLQHILPMIPVHRIYVEPFCGGAALFWAKQPSFLEVLNDLNSLVINFYQTILTDFESLNQKITDTIYSEELFNNALKIYQYPYGYSFIDQAWAFWMVTNFAFSGKIGGGWKWGNATGGSHEGVYFLGRKKEFTEAIQLRLSRVQLSCRDALLVIDNRDTPETFFHLDPPYPGADQGHYKGYSFDDMQQLLIRLETIRGKFMFCNYPSDMLLSYCSKNNWNTYSVDQRLSGCKTEYPPRQKTEMIITNYKQPQNLFS